MVDENGGGGYALPDAPKARSTATVWRAHRRLDHTVKKASEPAEGDRHDVQASRRRFRRRVRRARGRRFIVLDEMGAKTTFARRVAASLLKQDRRRGSIKAKRFGDALDPKYRERVLRGFADESMRRPSVARKCRLQS